MFSLLIEENENLKVLRSLRTLRALRPLRAISRWQGMRVNILQTKEVYFSDTHRLRERVCVYLRVILREFFFPSRRS